uniref:Uncharacterized protein n=1 Tax=Nymphaea colorata TaxID=210225 RepID=A0A5K1G474_9MAGN
MKPTQELLEWT